MDKQPVLTLSRGSVETILVSFQSHYGSVSSQWTTNGSHGFVARHIADHVRHGYTITDSILPHDLDYSDAEEVAESLKDTYSEWMRQFK